MSADTMLPVFRFGFDHHFYALVARVFVLAHDEQGARKLARCKLTNESDTHCVDDYWDEFECSVVDHLGDEGDAPRLESFEVEDHEETNGLGQQVWM